MDLETLMGSLSIVLGLGATMALLGRLGGWTSLARSYGDASDFMGRRFRFQSAQLRGWVGYNGCLTAGADPFALHLSIWPLLRVGHPPIRIPWEDVSVSLEKRAWGAAACLRFSKDPSVPVRISRRLAAKLAEESRGRFRIPG